MTFKRPIVSVRTLTRRKGGSQEIQNYQHEIYTYLSSKRVTEVAVGSGGGGTGYAVGDTFEAAGGTGIFAVIEVVSESGGVITAVRLAAGIGKGTVLGGEYTLDPTVDENQPTVVLTGSGNADAFFDLILSTPNWTTSLPVSDPDLVLLHVTRIPVSGGTGYAVGDTLTLSGGTGIEEAATLRVVQATAGVIGAVKLTTRGVYTAAPPSSPAATTTSGAGSGASIAFSSGALAGGYSFTATPVTTPDELSEPFQLNFRNRGASAAVMDSNEAHIGINPNGVSDPITDSASPTNAGTTSLNFSGNGATSGADYGPNFTFQTATTLHDQFLILDFGDVVAVLIPPLDRNHFRRGFMAGLVMQSRWSNDIDGDGGTTEVRIDGLGLFGYAPHGGSAGGSSAWISPSGGTARASSLRISTGNTIGENALTSSWLRNIRTTQFSETSTAYLIGPDQVPRVFHFPLWGKTNPGGDIMYLGEAKYIKLTTPALAYTKKQLKEGEDYLMHLHDWTDSRPMCIHIPNNLAPKTDGTYLP